MIVTCARCGHDWPEGDPGVRYASGDWWCNWEGECDDRMTQCAACGCDPANPSSLGGHAAGSCISPDCPAGCYEPDPATEYRDAITRAWRARIAADPNPERLQGAHDGQ